VIQSVAIDHQIEDTLGVYVKRFVMTIGFFAFCLAAVSPAGAQGDAGREWDLKAPWGKTRRGPPVSEQKIDPFKVFDNVYYVGTQSVSSFLVSTSAGLVMIDSTNPETGDALLDGVRSLGLDPKNIKYVLITHSHIDHYGGAGKVKQVSGARLGMSDIDWGVVEHSRQGPIPIKRDIVLKEGEPMTVGDTTFKFYLTPGHTPGAMSIEFQARDGNKSYRTLIPGGLGIHMSPEWTEPFIKSIEKTKKLGPFDVLLGNHPFLAPRDLIEIKKDLAKRGSGPHPALVTPAQANQFFDGVLKTAREKLAVEQAASARSAKD
jgi:metallo-beta-lactamase class B